MRSQYRKFIMLMRSRYDDNHNVQHIVLAHDDEMTIIKKKFKKKSQQNIQYVCDASNLKHLALCEALSLVPNSPVRNCVKIRFMKFANITETITSGS